MIERLKGKVIEKGPEGAVIDVGGVGLFVKLTSSALDSVKTGEQAQIFTVLFVKKDDEALLFGFSTREERVIFKKLLSVSGIGPKTAMNLLSFLGSDGFLEAVENEEVGRISRVPGIGRKGASRIIVEMKNFLPSTRTGEEKEVISALVNLGFKRGEIEDVVREVLREDLTVDDAIKEVLRRLS